MKTIWFDAQLKTPKGSQLCAVVGKTKAIQSIFPIYDERANEFQSPGLDKTYIPRT